MEHDPTRGSQKRRLYRLVVCGYSLVSEAGSQGRSGGRAGQGKRRREQRGRIARRDQAHKKKRRQGQQNTRGQTQGRMWAGRCGHAAADQPADQPHQRRDREQRPDQRPAIAVGGFHAHQSFGQKHRQAARYRLDQYHADSQARSQGSKSTHALNFPVNGSAQSTSLSARYARPGTWAILPA